jgi:outer membrane protein insertion porin family/translocation and assembly module TamA
MSLAVAALTAGGLRAQAQDGSAEAPRVTRVTFNGVQALDKAELKRSIQTEATRCRGLLLRPLCLIGSSSIWKETHRLDSLEVGRDELRIRVRYFQRGYREAEVESRIEPRNGDVEVIFDITEGAPTIIDSLAVEQAGEVLSERQMEMAFVPGEGDPLDLIRLDSARVRLREMLDRAGYLDAAVMDTVITAAGTHSAAVAITIEPNRRSTLDTALISGYEEVSESVIRTALDIRPGDVLTSDRIYGSQRNLYQSNMFRLARVTVPPQPDSAKLVEVEVVEAPLRGVNAGFGVNTVDFVQVEAGYTNYNFGGGGRLFDVQAVLGNLLASQLEGSSIFHDVLPTGFFGGRERAFVRPTYQASITLSQPGFRSSYRNTIAGNLFAHRRTVPGVAIDRGIGASVSFTRKIGPRSPLSAVYRYEVNTVEAGDVYFCINYGVCETPLIDALRDGQKISPLTLTFFSDRSDNPIAPTRGSHLSVDIEHASGLTLSDFRYNRVQAEYAHYLPLGLRRVLAARIRGGWVGALGSTGTAVGLDEEVELLHPRNRFYAGGSRSVRGFGENQLGPRILTVPPTELTDTATAACTMTEIEDGSCDPNPVPTAEFQPRPLGGQRLLEANIEYRFPLLGAIDGAVFVDWGWVGGSTDEIARGRSAITPGFGVRYGSPVGPIRVDLGVRPTDVQDLPVVTEVVEENGAIRLVRLSTPKRYDPLADAGAIGKIVNRLTLHLSIGQAF